MKLSENSTLKEWLAYCEALHTNEIDLGLGRVGTVRDALRLHFACPVIVVAGTNGKGSTCAMLESILHSAGYSTGVFSSPHLIYFEERCRIDLEMVDDVDLIPYFVAVEKARYQAGQGNVPVSLSYFEFTTLVILLYMSEQNLDVAILEVGLGGRLDAVNIIDSDCAVITSIGIDHVNFLGNTRESIALEKAGIVRAGKPTVIGDPMPPQNMLDYAEKLGAHVWQYGHDFRFDKAQDGVSWNWMGRSVTLEGLPLPALVGEHQLLNGAGVLAALEALKDKLPVSQAAVSNGLAKVVLAGRFQVVNTHPVIVLDVGHNPHAVKVLLQNLRAMGSYARTFAVFGAMRDKDIGAILELMLPDVDCWFFTDLPLPRAISSEELMVLAKKSQDVVNKPLELKTYKKPSAALTAAFKEAEETDRIIVFGSFFTVAGVLEDGLPEIP
ncbi:MAG: bifunctional tetrahydrofolate synthase/dihydrofolate synthase [Saezia sp.]